MITSCLFTATIWSILFAIADIHLIEDYLKQMDEMEAKLSKI